MTSRPLGRRRRSALGERLGRLLRRGDVVALVGELGAGKTCVRAGAGARARRAAGGASPAPPSPSSTSTPARVPLYHVDLYRLEDADRARGDRPRRVPRAAAASSSSSGPIAFPRALPAERLEVRIEITGADDAPPARCGGAERRRASLLRYSKRACASSTASSARAWGTPRAAASSCDTSSPRHEVADRGLAGARTPFCARPSRRCEVHEIAGLNMIYEDNEVQRRRTALRLPQEAARLRRELRDHDARSARGSAPSW